MTLFDSLRSVFGRAATQPSATTLQLQPWSSPPKRGSLELLRGYKTMPWLRAVTSRIGDACANVDLVVYRRDSAGSLGDPLTQHPLVSLLARPGVLTHRAARKLTHLHLDMVGESFWVKERNAQGVVVMLTPIPPTWITDVPGPWRTTFRVSHQRTQRELPREDVIWIKDIDPEEPYGRGAGLAASLADELDTDEYAAKHVKAFFFNRATPEVVVSVDGADKPTLDNYKASWDANHRGTWNAFRTLFTGRKVEIKRLDTAFREMQLVALRDAQRDRIVSVFGLPPEVLGILTSSNRSTIDAADVLMAKYVVAPRLDMLTDALTSDLASEWGSEYVIGYVNPVPDDREFTKGMMATRPSAFTDNEARTTAGLAPAEGKDTYPPPAPVFGALKARDADPEWTRSLPAKRNLADAAKRALEALRPERLAAQTDPVMLARVESWSRKVLADLGADAKFDLLNPLISKFVAEQSSTKITGDVSDTTREAIRATLDEGVRAGEDVDDLALRVEDVFDAADQTRAVMIARTEVVGASNWATREAQRVSGVVDERGWVATRDARTRESHAAMDGKTTTIDKPFRFVAGENAGADVDYPGGSGIAAEDIQCFPGDVCVETFGASDALFRRAYSGELVEITTEGGYKLAGTPNHPVLTARGWVALADLDESDDLVYAGVGDVVGAADAHPDNKPLTFQQVSDLAAIEGAAVRTCPSAAKDFHGDGREAEVDVVAVDRELGNRLQPSHLKHLAEAALAASGTASGSLPPDGASGAVGFGRDTAPSSLVGVAREGHPLLIGEASHPQSVGVRPASRSDAGGKQARSDRGPGEPERLGQGLLALAGHVAADQFGGVDVGAQAAVTELVAPRVDASVGEVSRDGVVRCADLDRDASKGNAGGVQFRRVVQKFVRQFSGHVYNLQTTDGMYTANGFTVHNCRCTTVAVISDDLDDERAAQLEAGGAALRRSNLTTERLDAQFRAYDQALIPWERDMLDALRTGFRQQQRDVLRALRGK